MLPPKWFPADTQLVSPLFHPEVIPGTFGVRRDTDSYIKADESLASGWQKPWVFSADTLCPCGCVDAHVHHYRPKLVHASASLQACTDSLSFMVGLTKLVSQAVPSSCFQPCSQSHELMANKLSPSAVYRPCHRSTKWLSHALLWYWRLIDMLIDPLLSPACAILFWLN